MNDFWQALIAAFTLIRNLDPGVAGIVALSLRVSLTASVIAMMLGAPLGAILAVTKFRGQQAAIVFANAMLGLPPVVAGLAIYILLSRSGPLGSAGLLFTPTAMIIAQVVLITPIVAVLVHRPLSLLWNEYGDLMQSDGLSKLHSLRLLFSIGRASLMTAFLASFGRAIAEVGAIIVVGGNIDGFTRTMTTSIALETGKGDLPLALGLGIILLTISGIVSTVAFLLVAGVREK